MEKPKPGDIIYYRYAHSPDELRGPHLVIPYKEYETARGRIYSGDPETFVFFREVVINPEDTPVSIYGFNSLNTPYILGNPFKMKLKALL